MIGEQGKPQQDGDEANASALAKGLADVIQAGLAAGSALARVTAEATAGGRPVAQPRQSDNALNAIVHYSIASIVNVVDAIVQGVQDARVTAATNVMASSAAQTTGESGRPKTTTGMSGLPTVHCGASLRIPLSLQNPGTEPMETLDFRCLEVRSSGESSAAAPLTPERVRFEPTSMTIAPLDFEKLTVFIDVPAETAPGHYEAIIGTTSGVLKTTIGFNVLPATGEPA